MLLTRNTVITSFCALAQPVSAGLKFISFSFLSFTVTCRIDARAADKGVLGLQQADALSESSEATSVTQKEALADFGRASTALWTWRSHALTLRKTRSCSSSSLSIAPLKVMVRT